MESATKFFRIDDNFTKMSDEEIISLIRDDNKEALNYLINKYKDLVYMKVSKYFIIGAERDDIVQEGTVYRFIPAVHYRLRHGVSRI